MFPSTSMITPSLKNMLVLQVCSAQKPCFFFRIMPMFKIKIIPQGMRLKACILYSKTLGKDQGFQGLAARCLVMTKWVRTKGLSIKDGLQSWVECKYIYICI